MRHAGAFLHLCYLPVSGVSMTLFLFNYLPLNNCLIDFHTLFSASVRKLAWTWAFPSSQPGASASRVTISQNWPEFCLRHARSQAYSSTLLRKPWHLRVIGSRSMSTRSPATQLKTASGETTQAAVHPSDLCSFFTLQHVLFISLFLPQVHQRIGSALFRLCLKYKQRDAAWGRWAAKSLHH